MTTLTRRRFLELGGSGFGLAVMVPATFSGIALGVPVGKRRRHLVNIHGVGGWDSSWHHSPMLLRDTAGLDANVLSSSFYGTISAPRFADNVAIEHAGTVIGPGMSAFSATDLSRVLIWRGMVKEGDHDVGNRLLQMGHGSGYAASYSTIVADALAGGTDYTRPLHYLQLTDNPTTFRSQVGFYQGPGVPLNVPQMDVWKALSAKDANDPAASAALDTVLGDAVGKLSGMSSKFKLEASKQRFSDDFKDAFEAAAAIRGKDYAASSDFVATMARFKAAIVADITKILFNGAAAPAVREALKLMPSMATAEANVQTFLNAIYGTGLDTLVFPYAVADFVVRNDLAAVVDVPAKLGDFHNFNDNDFLSVAVALACFRELTRSFAATPAGDGSGKSLLDVTLLTLSTEFDRELARTPQQTEYTTRPGTNHGLTVSVLMAGYGTNGGKVIGARAGGPSGAHGNLGEAFLRGVPIDLKTGLPAAGGEVVGPRAIAPTVLGMFGVAVPSQQKTEEVLVPAAIKPGHNAV